MNPHAIVDIDGKVFDTFLNKSLITGVRVELTTNQASMAELTVVDPDFSFLDSYLTDDGVRLAVGNFWLGYGQHLGPAVFKGLLASIDHGETTSTLRFYDMGLKMRLVQKTEYHKGLDIDVIKKLATRNGLMFEGPGKAFKALPLTSKRQQAQTDWHFAMSLAEDAGLVLYVLGDTLFARPAAITADPILTLARREVVMLRKTDLHYKLPENQQGRPGKVEVRTRGRGGARLSGSSDQSRGTRQVVIKTRISNESHLAIANRAQAKKMLRREHAFACRIQTIVPQSVRASVRDTIELIEMGHLFSGRYLVDTVSINLSPGSLKTDFDLYRDIKT